MSGLYPPEMGPTPNVRVRPRALERSEQRATFRRRVFYGLGFLAVLGLVMFSAYGVYAIRTAQSRNGETLRIVRDCTQPAGDCYQQGQKRTAKAVGDISATNILAVVCALQVPDDTPLQEALDQVTECVTKRLAQP